ncbi:MAG: hypothetical protein GY906_24780 [bacterium]|nr:hypothetical protein [bacterium]
MAGKRFYEPTAGDLTLWTDPNLFVKTNLEAELAVIEELRGLSNETRTFVALSQRYPSLETYDEFHLDASRTRLKNLIDFFDYDNEPLNLNVKEGAWFTPLWVEDFCGEEVGDEAALSIDGQNNTWWQHNVDHAHEITWRLRDYKKRMSKMEVRVQSSSRHKLTDVDIYIADTVAGLTNPNNLVLSGVNLILTNAWEEIDFGSKRNGQYIRFTGFGSQHGNNEVRIADVRMRVVTVEYD